jgi:PAS domain S-box-containing protein
VVEHAYDAFIAMDRQGKIRSWNAQAESTFGWPRSEAVGRDLADLIVPPQHREAHRAGLARYLSTGDGPALNKRIEITAMHRVGREFPVELAIWPVQEEEGVGSFNAFVHDIADRKRIDQDRSELADSLRAILETSREGIFEVDRSGHWTFMNMAAGALLGMDPSRVMGLDACSLIHRSADQAVHDQRTCVICYVLHTGKPAKYDFDRFWTSDGTSFTAECRTHPTVIRGEVEGAVVVFTAQQEVAALSSPSAGYPGQSGMSSMAADGANGRTPSEGWQ